MDWRPRSCHPAAAVRVGPACIGSAFADCPVTTHGTGDPGHRQAVEDSDCPDCPGSSGSHRSLHSRLPVSVHRRVSLVRRGAGRSLERRPRPSRGSRRSNAARFARHADSPRPTAQFCDPFAGAGCGPAVAPGTSGPREPVVDSNLHQGGRSTFARRLQARAPKGLRQAVGQPGRKVSRRQT